MRSPAGAARAAIIAIGLSLLPLTSGGVLGVDPEIVVQPGDTLTGIARRHGVSVEQLVSINRLADPDRILVGQLLRLVPVPGSPAPSAAASAPPAPAAPPRAAAVHVVRVGENLTRIARTYGTTVASIAQLNRLADPGHIVPGQRLSIPGKSAAVPVAGWVSYTVKRGDTLTAIAAAHGTTSSALAAANRLTDPSRILAGRSLLVPGAGSHGSAVSTTPAPAPAGSARAGGTPSTTTTTTTTTTTGPVPVPGWMAPLVAERDAVRQMIVAQAGELGVPPAFALAVAWQESGWQESVVSSQGAVGVMQLLPETADWVAGSILHEPVDIDAPKSNIRAGVRLLAHYLERYRGDRSLALAAYFQGQRAADEHGIYPVTRPYIASILLLERIFSS